MDVENMPEVRAIGASADEHSAKRCLTSLPWPAEEESYVVGEHGEKGSRRADVELACPCRPVALEFKSNHTRTKRQKMLDQCDDYAGAGCAAYGVYSEADLTRAVVSELEDTRHGLLVLLPADEPGMTTIEPVVSGASAALESQLPMVVDVALPPARWGHKIGDDRWHEHVWELGHRAVSAFCRHVGELNAGARDHHLEKYGINDEARDWLKEATRAWYRSPDRVEVLREYAVPWYGLRRGWLDPDTGWSREA